MSSLVPPGSDAVEDLHLLFERIVEARAEHRRQLGRRKNPARITRTREESLAAIENYVSALSRSGLPIPPRMHRDLELLRGLCASAQGG